MRIRLIICRVVALTSNDISVLYERYGALVLRRCRRILRDEALAWDAMHQTFVCVLHYKDTFRGESHPLPWLYTIALRVCLRDFRGAAERMFTESEELDDVIDEPTDLSELLSTRREIAGLLSKFSDDVQEIVVMRYFDGLELEQISDRVGVSERTVARRLRLFLERSRKILQVV